VIRNAGVLAVVVALGGCGGGSHSAATPVSAPSPRVTGKYVIEKAGSRVDASVDCVEIGRGFADCKVKSYGSPAFWCRHVRVSEMDRLANRRRCPSRRVP